MSAKRAIVNGVHIPTLARQYGQEAIELLVSIMRDTDAAQADRIKCASLILDRGYGKAPAVVVAPGDARLADYTDADLQAMIDAESAGQRRPAGTSAH